MTKIVTGYLGRMVHINVKSVGKLRDCGGWCPRPRLYAG